MNKEATIEIGSTEVLRRLKTSWLRWPLKEARSTHGIDDPKKEKAYYSTKSTQLTTAIFCGNFFDPLWSFAEANMSALDQ